MNLKLIPGIAALLLGAVEICAAPAKEKVPAANADAVTFNKDIAPIFYKNCVTCHRSGEVAPFSLLTYAEAKKHAKQIETVTRSHYMPPWKSVPGHGNFVGERRLAASEIDLIARWVARGMPEGVRKDLPLPPAFPDEWKLGKPDIVVTMPVAYEIPAGGPDIYRNFVLNLDVPKGKYIKATEFRPSNRSIVHHAVLAIDTTGRFRKEDEADPAPGFRGNANIPGRLLPGSTGIWTPGRDPMPLPEGLSMPWKAGADLVLQLHLHPSGKAESEQSTIGIYLTDEPPRRSMVDLLLIDKKIDIEPGDSQYRTHDEFVLPIEMEAMGVFPHMHLIGHEIKITAYPPEASAFSLLWINDWDFNWQSFYQFTSPVKLPAGTKIVMEAVHDNSAANARNPNRPPKQVVWGEETSNEMTVAIIQTVPVNEVDGAKLAPTLRNRMLGMIRAVKQ